MPFDMDEIAKAVMADNQNRIVSLVSKGVDVSGDSKRITGLMAAAMKGNEKMMRFLLKRGARADVQFSGDSNRQAIHLAAFAGNASCLKILISEGHADPNAVDAGGHTPLHCVVAAATDKAEAVRREAAMRVLLEAGASINARIPDGSTTLHGACGNGHLNLVRLMLEAGADVDVVDVNNVTCLYATILRGHTDVVRALLDAGANHNIMEAGAKLAPLHAAAACDNVGLIKLLLDAGAAIEGPPGCAMTPLELAFVYQSLKAMKLLAKRGADISVIPKRARSVELVTAAKAGAFERVAQLLANPEQVDVKCRDTTGNTPLHYACEHGATGVVKRLLGAGADVHATEASALGSSKRTPLSDAVESGHAHIAKLLLDAGADPNAKSGTKSNHPLLHIVAATGDTASASVLLAAGADPLLTDSMGRTALDLAKKNKHNAVAALFTSALAARAAGAAPPQLSDYCCSAPGCGKPADMVCSGCKRAHYCNKDCQRAHWRAGHKQECAALKSTPV